MSDAATPPPPAAAPPVESRHFLRKIWALASPYFASEERLRARLTLGSIIGLTLAQIAIQIRFNWWNADFFNALEKHDQGAFFYQILTFLVLAAGSMVVTVFQLYLKQSLQLHWRRWLTHHLTRRWLHKGLHYQLNFIAGGIDNPDQRIAEDTRVVTDAALDFLIGIVNSGLMFISFIGILWTLSGTLALTVFGLDIHVHGYMVWFALAYALAGSALTWAFGRPMVRINAERNAREADFRFSLVRVRENSEGIALSRGEPDELRLLERSFETLFGTVWRLMKFQRRLTWLSSGYTLGALVIPALVAAPRYFAGAITLGGLMQTTSAFGQVQGSLSWFVENWPRISEWRASVDRLLRFADGIAETAAEVGAEEEEATITVVEGPDDRLTIEQLDIAHPDGTIVVYQANAEVRRGEKVLIVGESGTGKSTLFRAIAGLWPWGRGRVATPADADVMFVPQRPYLPLGSLRGAIAYPSAPDRFDDATVCAALDRCGLAHLSSRLDDEDRWDQTLSGGELQRVAFARMLLNRPSWVFMDEGTSALDDDSQTVLMSLFRSDLSATSLLSIGHRAGLDQFHDRTLTLVHAPEGARLVRKRRAHRQDVGATERAARAFRATRIGRFLKRGDDGRSPVA
jgi:vitamin B12/bleomycin/antimicrobial peptide transport system ATP-binding/permease protein